MRTTFYLLFACMLAVVSADQVAPADIDSLKPTQSLVDEALSEENSSTTTDALEYADGPAEDTHIKNHVVQLAESPSLLLGDIRITPVATTPGPNITDEPEEASP